MPTSTPPTPTPHSRPIEKASLLGEGKALIVVEISQVVLMCGQIENSCRGALLLKVRPSDLLGPLLTAWTPAWTPDWLQTHRIR